MKLYFATEARFVKSKGAYHSLGGFSVELWKRYLEHFDHIVVIARVKHDDSYVSDPGQAISIPEVTFLELPYYVGFRGYLQNRKEIHAILNDRLSDDGCHICRLPGQVGGEVIRVLKRKGIPYACEVVGDPWDVFAPGAVSHPLRPILRIVSAVSLKRQVASARAVLYVTRYTLQKRYPASDGAFSAGVSDVIIRDDVMAAEPEVHAIKDHYVLLSIGSLEQMYKAPDIVIAALASLRKRGRDVRLIWLGDGRFKDEMIALAADTGVTAEFKGNVPSDVVHSIIGQCDMFVLASRTEGLPRAVVEAMAHGVPCIGTRVGGIPELLDDEALVEKEDPEALADLIEKLIDDSEFYDAQARRNLTVAYQYGKEHLDALRGAFFDYIKVL